MPPRAAVPRHGADRARARDRGDRDDRREHPGPALRRGTRSGRSGERRPRDGGRQPERARYRRILLKLSGEALLGEPPVRRRPGRLRVHRAAGRGRPRAWRRGRHRRRRRQHLPRPGRGGPGHGSRDRRLHRHARDGHERPRAAGRGRAGRRPDPGHERDRDERDRRAVHPAARGPAPREGPGRDLRRRHRQPVLHDRYGGRAARRRDRRRGPPQGDQGRRGLRCGPDDGPGRPPIRPARIHRPAARPAQGARRRGRLAVHGERPADHRLRPERPGQHRPRRRRRGRRHAHHRRRGRRRRHERRDPHVGRSQDGPGRRGHGARPRVDPDRPRVDRRSSSASTSTTTARRRRSTSSPGSASRSPTRS